MRGKSPQKRAGEAWQLAERQHGVISRRQLLGLGFSARQIESRLGSGRLHRLRRGVYAVGRPEVTRRGEWMAAVLSCGRMARLADESAGALWGVRNEACGAEIHVVVPPPVTARTRGVVVHRQELSVEDCAVEHGIPVTSVVRTLIDLARTLSQAELERAVADADKLDLIDPESLSRALETRTLRSHGAARLRGLLERGTFTLTDSELERRFLSLARRAGLSSPRTQVWLNGFRVDFFWPALGLVVETDGLRYHRTAAQQARDRRRDQVHSAAGLTALRFSHGQVAHEQARVVSVLRRVAERLAGAT